MKRYRDTTQAIKILKNLEASDTEDAAGLKLEIIGSEGEVLISQEGFKPLEALKIMRELNCATAPRIPDSELTKALTGFVKGQLKDMDRGNDLPQNAASMFQAAENELAMQRGIEPVRLHVYNGPRKSDKKSGGG